MESPCEVAVNIIKSNFSITKSLIANTHSDALDVDFSIGKISQLEVRNAGKNAIDFSDSRVSILKCTINKAGETGIRAGQSSEIKIIKASINDVNDGLVANDFSKVQVQHIQLKNCAKGLSAFVSKSAYGPATINVKILKEEAVKILQEASNDCVINLPEK